MTQIKQIDVTINNCKVSVYVYEDDSEYKVKYCWTNAHGCRCYSNFSFSKASKLAFINSCDPDTKALFGSKEQYEATSKEILASIIG